MVNLISEKYIQKFTNRKNTGIIPYQFRFFKVIIGSIYYTLTIIFNMKPELDRTLNITT